VFQASLGALFQLPSPIGASRSINGKFPSQPSDRRFRHLTALMRRQHPVHILQLVLPRLQFFMRPVPLRHRLDAPAAAAADHGAVVGLDAGHHEYAMAQPDIVADADALQAAPVEELGVVRAEAFSVHAAAVEDVVQTGALCLQAITPVGVGAPARMSVKN